MFKPRPDLRDIGNEASASSDPTAFQEGPLAYREPAAAGVENEPRISQLDVAGMVWLDHAAEGACGKGSLSFAGDPITGS